MAKIINVKLQKNYDALSNIERMFANGLYCIKAPKRFVNRHIKAVANSNKNAATALDKTYLEGCLNLRYRYAEELRKRIR